MIDSQPQSSDPLELFAPTTPVVVVDRNGTIVAATEAALALAPRTVDEKALRWWQVVGAPPSRLPGVVRQWDSSVSDSAETISWHAYEIRGRGYVFLGHRSVQPRQGTASTAAPVGEELSQRLHDEVRHRRASERRLRDLFEYSPLMDVVTRLEDSVPRIVDCNRAFAERLGYVRQELVGQPLSMVYHPDSAEKMLGGDYVASLSAPLIDAERTLITKEGREVRTLLSAIPTFDSQGAVVGTRAMYLDVTERLLAQEARIAEAEARKARDAAEQMARLKDEVLSVVSHEIRTPMTSLIGFSELLLSRDFEPSRQRELIATIHQEAKRLSRLVDDFLSLHSLENRQDGYRFGAVDLLETTENVLATLLPSQRDRVVLRSERNQTLIVRGDAHALRQVISNLLANALKYSPSPEPVEIRLASEETLCSVEVSDRGDGIAEHDLDRIFDKFFRCDDHREVGGGSGLGLSIVDQIVRDHGATIDVASEVGSGSRFVIELPKHSH